ncbi:MAG: hypothetical protein ISEC1_P0570 [Thiomicrorhabdus sp.]|nr:MAG: hypothetical protein ISEC1_P0570 [Thiomicrorhabdus sp.]
MAQGFISALIMGSKEEGAARKVIKVAAYLGLIKLAVVLILVFVPIEFIQEILDQDPMSKLITVGVGLVVMTCLVYMLLGRLWAPIVLIIMLLADIVITYIESEAMPGLVKVVELLFYASAAQALHFLSKLKEASSVQVEP